jgi:hypothetical protein
MTAAAARESGRAWAPDRQLDGRGTRGLTVEQGRIAGLRVRSSVDLLVEGLAATGWIAERRPIEDRPPAEPCVGVVQTWGSPWVDVLERRPGELLDDRLAARLSQRAGLDVLRFDYDFGRGAFGHALYREGAAVERLERRAAWCESLREEIVRSYRAWHMRDWGLGFDRLVRLDLPFAPQLIVEAYFLGLSPTAGAGAAPADEAPSS